MKLVSIAGTQGINHGLLLTYEMECIAQDESALFDQRSFDAFMNCEPPAHPTFEQRMRLGPLPRVCLSKPSNVDRRRLTGYRNNGSSRAE